MIEAVTQPHDELDAYVRSQLADLGHGHGASAAPETLLALFDAMAGSRQLDIHARRMRERGQGFYTIGSAGHESNAVVAARPSDDGSRPAALPLGCVLPGAVDAGRSEARGRPARRAARLVAGAVADPASGGRHKVFGHPALSVIPQTSTIASHLPRAVGSAFAIDRARRIGVDIRWPRRRCRGLQLRRCEPEPLHGRRCAQHGWLLRRLGLPIPLLFVCEDNGFGISVRTPFGWVAAAAQRPGIEYVAVDGEDSVELEQVAAAAVERVRAARRPVFLHLRTVRFLATPALTSKAGTAELAR